MPYRWIVTPSFFDVPEDGFVPVAPEGATHMPHLAADRSGEELRKAYGPILAFTEEAVSTGHVPVSLAGDCCASMPVLGGLQAAGIQPTLIWLDAHGDFNTPETSPSQFLGGMPLAMMTGRGPQWLNEVAHVTPIADEQVVLVDARDLDPGEKELVEASSMKVISLAETAELNIDGPVHLHIDTDIVNSDEIPAFNYPVPGGPGIDQLAAAVADLTDRLDVRAVSISAWNGSMDKDGSAMRGFAKVLAPYGAKAPAEA